MMGKKYKLFIPDFSDLFRVFFAYVKVHMSFIRFEFCVLFSVAGKKHSIFIHSIDFVQKFVKYELLQGKKYGSFAPGDQKSTPKNFNRTLRGKKANLRG